MFWMRSFIFWARLPSLLRQLTFIFQPDFDAATKYPPRASTLPSANDFMANIEQQVTITPFAVSHECDIAATLYNISK